MKYLVQLKALLKDIWEDFKNPVSHEHDSSTCCSYGSIYMEKNLRPELLKINEAGKGINKS
ncbi:hypothetical protein [Salinimicrobium xinjiangense]|uniref:hypothetical protein n=1 Tax=Salinimicrobium xinjiangense TaxID=438596 RepID=UPI000414841A|nr:hypothetical protein [Salinimicrobium xinjiangense]